MAETEAMKNRKAQIKYKGVMDFVEVFKVCMDWFESKGYEVNARKVKHKVLPLGEENEQIIDAWRNVTDYIRFKMELFAKYWDGHHVEVIKNGKKVDMVKARFYFRVYGTLVFDYDNRYEKTKMTKALSRFMNKYVLKWQIDVIYGDQLHYKVHELHAVIREYLKMEAQGNEFADMW